MACSLPVSNAEETVQKLTKSVPTGRPAGSLMPGPANVQLIIAAEIAMIIVE